MGFDNKILFNTMGRRKVSSFDVRGQISAVKNFCTGKNSAKSEARKNIRKFVSSENLVTDSLGQGNQRKTAENFYKRGLEIPERPDSDFRSPEGNSPVGIYEGSLSRDGHYEKISCRKVTERVFSDYI